jgi:hypothetical protein
VSKEVGMSTDGMSTSTGPASPDLRAAAVRRLKAKREFGQHLIAYVTVNAVILALWAIVGAGAGFWFPWFLFPMLGWGIGLVFHAWSTFGPPSRPFSQSAIDREMQRLGPR